MPGFDTLGVRLARSRRRLERERAANVERPAQDGRDIAVRGEGASTSVTSSVPMPPSAQVISFPRPNGRTGD